MNLSEEKSIKVQEERLNSLVPEVGKEIFKLMEIFKEGFLNHNLEFIICHPINPVDIDGDMDNWAYKQWHGKGKNVYCNVYFLTENCKTKLDVQRKVLEWWSRAAYKTEFASKKANEQIHKYIRNGINEYLQTNFTEDDLELIYTKLGNAIRSELCENFIKSGFDMSLLTNE